MLGSAITFVAFEAVCGILAREGIHDAVARHFGDDGGGGDAEAGAVAADDFFLQDGEFWNEGAVHEDVIGREDQTADGGAHGVMGGAEDVEGVNHGVVSGADGNGEGAVVGADQGIEFFAFGGGELFGVEDACSPAVAVIGGKINCATGGGGDDGAGQGAAAGFIYAGDTGEALGVEGAFALQKAFAAGEQRMSA